jgi:shikimate kinase
MRIFLIGYMGSGKTTAGKKLAQKLGFEFIDLDTLIEQQQGKTIAELFNEEGEPRFREIEKQVLHSTFNTHNAVISTGGGAPCFFDNMEQMNHHGKTIYIELEPKTLVDRLRQAKQERPLIKDKTDEALLAFVEEALEKRSPFYQKAQATVKGINLKVDDLEKTL